MAHADLAARRAAPHNVRMPKLAYRNPLPADQTSLSSQNTSSSDAPSNEAYVEQRPLTAISTTISTTASSPLHDSFGSRSVSSSPSLASNGSTGKDSKASSKKKKGNNMLGFLTLKEPSQSALQQFAEQQRKQAAEKGDKASPVGLGTISLQKLPANVPKVNSKWDGVPESVKSVKSRDSMSISKKRMSTSTRASSRPSSAPSIAASIPNTSMLTLASTASHGPPNSLASAACSVSDFSRERRDSVPSITDLEKRDPSISSPSTTTLPEMTCFFPNDANLSGASGQHPVHQSLAPTASATSTLANPSRTSTMDEATIIALTTPPALVSSIPTDATAKTRELSHKVSLHGFMAGEAQEIELPEDDDESFDSGEDSHAFLFELQQTTANTSPLPSPTVDALHRPTAMNFSRPLSSQHANPMQSFGHSSAPTSPYRQGFSELPTLYEASIATNDTSDTITDWPDGESQLNDSDAASIAPSFTPSEMSASWYQTPRERLGLGGRIRKSDVLPWDSQGGLQPGLLQRRPISVPPTRQAILAAETAPSHSRLPQEAHSGSLLPRHQSI